MTAFDPPPTSLTDRLADAAAIGHMLNQRLVYIVAAAWADGAYVEGRSDLRVVMVDLADDARRARAAGCHVEAGGCERASEALGTLWAMATDALLNRASGHPAWDGLADRLWDAEPAAPVDE